MTLILLQVAARWFVLLGLVYVLLKIAEQILEW